MKAEENKQTQYVPLYRKWRSQNFDEIVGQEFIVQTLKNAVKTGRVAHAYLFSGPRGTGKTSTARILAKALNCVKGPTPDPCGTCDLCVKIKNGHAIDVIEIDAASNRGIDEIRNLREGVRYTPVEGRYKVYIIDEVHMLTSEAFNALLKTLEEPPAHAVFMLATTEAQKVPVTIASRCQRLDFRRLSNPEILAQLKKIADAEGIKIDDAGASMIARNSDGSMRDAISLFDQLISFSGKNIKADDVIAVLGTANTDVVFEFGESLGKNDVGRLFELVNTMASSGRSIPQATKDILLHLRNLMFTLLGSDSVIEESSEHLARLKAQAKLFTLDRIKEMMRIFSRAEVDMKWHPQARLLLEVAVMESCGNSAPAQAEKTGPIKFEKVINEVKLAENKPPEKKPVEIKKEEIISAAAEPENKANDSLSAVKMKWDAVLNEVKKKSIHAYIALHEADPFRMDNGTLVIRFRKGFGFHKATLDEGPARNAAEEALKKVYGRDIKLDSVIDASIAAAAHEEIADKAADLFGGQVIS
jgi:DNA polymerase III subunit gamma/tau